jgi:hypothetical protein
MRSSPARSHRLFSGIELALSSKLQEHAGSDLFLVLLMAAIGVTFNPAVAFAVGLPTAYAFKRGWLSLHTFLSFAHDHGRGLSLHLHILEMWRR